MIRTSAQNRFNAKDLLVGETKTSLIEHAGRALGKYNEIASNCTKGYITVLPATIITSTADKEYDNFKKLMAELKEKHDGAILQQHIMVAVAAFGWAIWDVLLWDPVPKKCARFEIKRQRSMYKIIEGKAAIARH